MASSVAMERFCLFLFYKSLENRKKHKTTCNLVGNEGRQDLCLLISCTFGDYFQQLGQLYADKLIDFFFVMFDFEHNKLVVGDDVYWCKHGGRQCATKNRVHWLEAHWCFFSGRIPNRK